MINIFAWHQSESFTGRLYSIGTLLKIMDDDGIRFVYKANDVTLFPFLRQLKCCYTEAEINVQRI